MRSRILSIIAITVLCAAACTRSGPQTAAPSSQQASPFFVKTTIREIMDAQVDPAADALWDSVAFYSTLQGPEEHQPRTDEEWKAVRREAVRLLESTNLIVMEGRQIAPLDIALEPGELSPALLQGKLDSNRAPFVGFAQALRALSLKAIDAIDAKDPQRLFEVGGEIDEACESCHLVYWYPPDAKP